MVDASPVLRNWVSIPVIKLLSLMRVINSNVLLGLKQGLLKPRNGASNGLS